VADTSASRALGDPDHERFRDALYADESIRGLDEHLAACEACRGLAERLERMDRQQRDAPIPELRPSLLAEILAMTGAGQ
jgi:hypothetical protein